MKNIAIIGAGQIGSRHLQAILLHNKLLNLYLVDPNKDSLEMCKKRVLEVESGNNHTIHFLDKMKLLPKVLDVVIIATNSAVRLQVLQSLTQICKVKYLILEKFLFPKIDQYEIANKILFEQKITAFVNCSRRIQPIYKELKQKLKNRNIYSINISGSNWNLASNSIHFLDLFAYLTNTENVYFSSEFLEREILKNKREGYIEFAGTLIGKNGQGSSLTMTSHREGQIPLIVTIESEDMKISIAEGSEKLCIQSSKNNWFCYEENFTFLYQSRLTNLVIEELIEKGTCGLPTIEESTRDHLILLRTFESFLKTVNYSGEGVIT